QLVTMAKTASSLLLSNNIRLYTARISSSSRRPLVVFFPWLLAKEGPVNKFVELYHRLGLDVIVAQGQAKHFVAPQSGRKFVADLHQCLVGQNWLDGRDLFFHGTSVGAYLLTLFQMRLAEQHNQQVLDSSLNGCLRGQVMDSIVYGSVDRMVTGLVDNVVQLRFLRSLSHYLIGGYFNAFHSSTLQFYQTSIDFYQSRLAPTPVLFVYSANDSLCDTNLLEQHLLPTMQARGHTIDTLSWPESIHAAHYYQHPDEYVKALEKFIISNCRDPLSNLPNPSAKL
ncbi:hypothetical protein BOX15_Mlig028857g2, partial [Macrostomum lignano]